MNTVLAILLGAGALLGYIDLISGLPTEEVKVFPRSLFSCGGILYMKY